MNFMKLIDTNVLIYLCDNRNLDKKNKSVEAVSNGEFVVSIQNLAELSRAMSEKARITPTKIKEYITGFAESYRRITYHESTLLKALDLKEEFGLHFFDSLIVATMQENGIYEIITENEKDFSKIPFIKVINPFKK